MEYLAILQQFDLAIAQQSQNLLQNLRFLKKLGVIWDFLNDFLKFIKY